MRHAFAKVKPIISVPSAFTMALGRPIIVTMSIMPNVPRKLKLLSKNAILMPTKKYLNQKVARAPAQPLTPPQSASAYMTNPTTDLEAQHQNLTISIANQQKLHSIWMQSHPGSSSNQN